MATRTVLVRVIGRVQGVGFRDWVMHQALARKLEGWVRNRADGSVEALFAGPGEGVDSMIAACHIGPGASRVLEVKSEPWAGPVPAGFSRRPTA